MRTTVDLDEHLLEAAKERARSRGSSVSSVLEDALRLLLTAGAGRHEPLKLPSVGHGGPRSGVDLTSTSQLLEDWDNEVPLHQRR